MPLTQTQGPWTECVTPDDCEADPSRHEAHHGVLLRETCECGAIRLCERNNHRTNYSEWDTDPCIVHEPPSLDRVIKSGYSGEAAQQIVDQEQKAFQRGEYPYGNKPRTDGSGIGPRPVPSDTAIAEQNIQLAAEHGIDLSKIHKVPQGEPSEEEDQQSIVDEPAKEAGVEQVVDLKSLKPPSK